MTCAVLRCEDPVSHVETVREKDWQVDAPFCAAHWSLKESGARWRMERQTHPVILMGEDLPPLLVKASYSQDITQQGFVEATFVLQQHDGTDDVVVFDVPEDKILDVTRISMLRGT